MRIIHLNPGTADPNTANGVNKVVHWLATSMVAQGHDCEVWSLLETATPPSHPHTYKLETFARTRSRFVLPSNLQAALSALPKDTWVQLHSVFVPDLTSAAKLLRRNKIKFGITPHGGYLSEGEGSSFLSRVKKRLFLSLWEGWTPRHASLIHAIGQTEVEDLNRRFSSLPRIVLLPNGFGRESDQPSPLSDQTVHNLSISQEDALTKLEPDIVYCGRMATFQKGLNILLKGFALYRQSGGTLRLTMVGDGLDRPRLQILARELGVEDAVTWTGKVFGASLHRLLRRATAFVHSSRFDVIPTACLEAASCGVPLLVSEETNLGSYVRRWNAGLILNPNTPSRLAEALKQIQTLEPSDLAAMGASANEMIETDFTWSEITRRLLQAIEEERIRP